VPGPDRTVLFARSSFARLSIMRRILTTSISIVAAAMPIRLATADGRHVAVVDPPTPTTTDIPDPSDLLAIERLIADAEASGEVIVIDDDAPAPVTRRAPTAGIRELDSRAIATTPHKNADDLLRLVPGLYTSQHGAEGKAQQFFLRGFDAVHGSDVEVRVAGVPINELSNVHGHGYVDLGFVIPETVVEIAARKGSFDLRQGPFATAGSVELELGVDAPDRGTRVGYEVGTTNRHRAVAIVAPAGGPREEVAAIDVMRDGGFGDNRDSERASVLAQTRLAIGDRAWLAPLVVAHAGRFGEPGVLAAADVASGYFDRHGAPSEAGVGESQRVLGGARGGWSRGRDRVTGQLATGWRHLRLDENFTGYLDDAVRGDARRQVHSATTTSGRLWWRHELRDGIASIAGADVVVDQLGQMEDRITTDGVAWRGDRALSATTAAGAVAAGVEIDRGPLLATAGVRADGQRVTARDRLDAERSGTGTAAAISPRAAVAWRGGGWTISAAYGRGLRPPEARAFTDQPTPPTGGEDQYRGDRAVATVSDAVEVGGRVQAHRSIAVGGAGFATRVDREALFDHVSGANVELDGTRRLGVEAWAEWSPVDGVALRGDATVADARFVVTGNPIPGAPRILGSLEARLARGAWNAAVLTRHIGRRPLAHGATGSAATVVDAMVGWRRASWQLTAQIDNVLASDWNEGEYHFASHWDASQPASNVPRLHASPGRPFGVRLGIERRF
jgi:hypothetical protein